MGGSPGSPSQPNPPFRDHREVPRYSFIADVDLAEPSTDTHISGRISEISRKGCYVDVLNTLPEGTSLQVKISRDQGVFTSKARIIYVQPGMGMGVAFVEIPADQLKTLDAWLAEIKG
ncbi:MAG: PilZ domain-containing protein [Candidatus Acidiferrales bacterium]